MTKRPRENLWMGEGFRGSVLRLALFYVQCERLWINRFNEKVFLLNFIIKNISFLRLFHALVLSREVSRLEAITSAALFSLSLSLSQERRRKAGEEGGGAANNSFLCRLQQQ